jgi:glycerol-3-phosphate responsive antiterminator
MKRTCVKKATQFQSAVTRPKIYVYSHLDIIYGLQDNTCTMDYLVFHGFLCLITRRESM